MGVLLIGLFPLHEKIHGRAVDCGDQKKPIGAVNHPCGGLKVYKLGSTDAILVH